MIHSRLKIIIILLPMVFLLATTGIFMFEFEQTDSSPIQLFDLDNHSTTVLSSDTGLKGSGFLKTFKKLTMQPKVFQAEDSSPKVLGSRFSPGYSFLNLNFIIFITYYQRSHTHPKSILP